MMKRSATRRWASGMNVEHHSMTSGNSISFDVMRTASPAPRGKLTRQTPVISPGSTPMTMKSLSDATQMTSPSGGLGPPRRLARELSPRGPRGPRSPCGPGWTWRTCHALDAVRATLAARSGRPWLAALPRVSLRTLRTVSSRLASGSYRTHRSAQVLAHRKQDGHHEQERDDDGDENCRPRDVFHYCSSASGEGEQKVNWYTRY